MRDGIKMFFDNINASDDLKRPIGGKRLEIVWRNDQYDPNLTRRMVPELIDKEKVLLLIGNVGTPTVIVTLPIVNDKQTLLFAPFTGAGILRNPEEKYVINYRASYAQETAKLIDCLVNKIQIPLDEIAFFTQNDTYGMACYEGGKDALKQIANNNNAPLDESEITQVRYERDMGFVQDALAQILLATRRPKAIIMAGTALPCSEFMMKAAIGSGLTNCVFANVSFVGTDGLQANLPLREAFWNDRVIISQVVPNPSGNTPDNPIVSEFRGMRGERNQFTALEGFIAAKILYRVLVKIISADKQTPTTENIIAKMRSLNNEDIGLPDLLSYDANTHQLSNSVWITVLENNTWVSITQANSAAIIQRIKAIVAPK